MAFKLGNFAIDEILYGTAQNFSDELLYTLDQLSSASIEISAESTDITDKKGNVVRTVYTSKSGTFNATNAFLHPALMNAASGSDIESATTTAAIEMPKMVRVEAGKSIDVTDAKTGSIHVVGLFGNGANSDELTQDTTASLANNTYGIATSEGVTTLTVPAASEGSGSSAITGPTIYVVRYQRDVTSGLKLVNRGDKFPNSVRLTLYCSYVDPCSDVLKPCYVYLPSFMPDPNVTISLDRESQEMDFNGTVQLDYCSTEKTLYIIYFPEEDIYVSGTNA